MAIPYATEVSVIVGAIATLMGLAASAIAKIRSYGWWPQPISPDYIEPVDRLNRVELGLGSPIAAARKHVRNRMDEVTRKLQQETTLEMQYRWSGVSLIIGQYVVGGLLASSFMQQSFSRNVVGFLGLIVLASSIVRQQFHPELLAVGAKQRSARLRSIIRRSEDDMEELEHLTPVTAAQYHAVARRISSSLDDLDLGESEILENSSHEYLVQALAARKSSTDSK